MLITRSMEEPPPLKKFKVKIIFGKRKATEKDLISNLGDDILHKILSFLETKYALRTRMLSKRWLSVWATSPHMRIMVMRKYGWSRWDGSKIRISSPKLTTLVFDTPPHDITSSATGKNINANNLVYLDNKGDAADEFGLSNFGSLTQAKARLRIPELKDEQVRKLLPVLPYVSSLTLSDRSLEVLSRSEEWRQVRTQQRTTRDIFSQLTTFLLTDFSGYQNEIDMIKLILSNAKILETVTLGWSPLLRPDVNLKVAAVKDICKLRRSSPLCTVRFS